MIILNTISVMKDNPIAVIFLIGLILAMLAAIILELKHHTNAAILSGLFVMFFFFGLTIIEFCDKILIPTDRVQYEVYVEDPAALEGYEIVDQRGLIYTIEEIENADT